MSVNMATQSRCVFVPVYIDPQSGDVKVPSLVGGKAVCIAYVRNAVVRIQNTNTVELHFTNNPCHKVWGLIVETQSSQGNFIQVYSDFITLLECKDTQCRNIQQIFLLRDNVTVTIAAQQPIQQGRVSNAAQLADKLQNSAKNVKIDVDDNLKRKFESFISGSTIYYLT